jgi:hypothetical protein
MFVVGRPTITPDYEYVADFEERNWNASWRLVAHSQGDYRDLVLRRMFESLI